MKYKINKIHNHNDIIKGKIGMEFNRFSYEDDFGTLFSEAEINRLFQLLNVFGYTFAKNKFNKVKDSKYIKFEDGENPIMVGLVDDTFDSLILENAPYIQKLLGKQKTSQLFKNDLTPPDVSHCEVQSEEQEILIEGYINYKNIEDDEKW